MAEKVKSKELVYSNQTTGYEAGRRYSNPRFFTGNIREGTTSVIVVGDWPAVVDAYKRAGIPVKIVAPGAPLGEAKDAPDRPAKGEGNGTGLQPPAGGGGGGSGDGDIDLSKIDIPSDEELADMDWTDLRAKVKELDGTVTNKEAAKVFIAEMRAKKEEAASA